MQIEVISEPFVNKKQIKASSSSDEVLQNSATGFLQGVYPPFGTSANQTLRNDCRAAVEWVPASASVECYSTLGGIPRARVGKYPLLRRTNGAMSAETPIVSVLLPPLLLQTRPNPVICPRPLLVLWVP